MISAVLIAASCGASDGGDVAGSDESDPAATTSSVADTPATVDTESSDGSSPAPDRAVVVDQAQAAADLLIAVAGDESAATRTRLLSSDLGYSVDQIVVAPATARLQTDGVVLNEEGTVLTPAREPGLLLAEHSPASGLRTPPEQLRASDVIDWAGRVEGNDAGTTGLVLLLMLLLDGYSIEQIVDAVIADQAFDDELRLVDEGGRVVPPELPRREYPDWATDGWVEPVPTTAVSERQPGETTPSDDDPELADLVERAAGVYAITDDLTGQLASAYNSPGVEVTDIVTTGELVIEVDGVVSGEFSYAVTQRTEILDAVEIVVQRVEFVLAPTPVELLDDGLAFEAEVTTNVVVAEVDMGAITSTSSGIVDVDLGQIVVSGVFSLEAGDSVRFERN